MTTVRRTSRPEPIITEVESVDSKMLRFEAVPLPWRERNDFGDEMVQQHLTALNEGIQEIGEGKDAHLVGKRMDAMIDYEKLFKMGYPNGSTEDFQQLTFEQMMEVLSAALDVNLLESQRYMIDPNFNAPNRQNRDGGSTDGQKTTSTEDSSSPALELVTSNP